MLICKIKIQVTVKCYPSYYGFEAIVNITFLLFHLELENQKKSWLFPNSLMRTLWYQKPKIFYICDIQRAVNDTVAQVVLSSWISVIQYAAQEPWVLWHSGFLKQSTDPCTGTVNSLQASFLLGKCTCHFKLIFGFLYPSCLSSSLACQSLFRLCYSSSAGKDYCFPI